VRGGALTVNGEESCGGGDGGHHCDGDTRPQGRTGQGSPVDQPRLQIDNENGMREVDARRMQPDAVSSVFHYSFIVTWARFLCGPEKAPR